jgi:hypothetical protein
MSQPMAGTHASFLYRHFVRSLNTISAFTLAGTATSTHLTTPDIILTDSSATFLTSGVKVGDTVENLTDAGSTATVVTVDSETQITTTVPSGGAIDEWTSGDSYTIDSATTVLRLSTLNSKTLVRVITGYTNAASGSYLKVFYGNSSSPEFQTRLTQNMMFQIDPDIRSTNERVLIELDTAGTASLQCSYEFR